MSSRISRPAVPRPETVARLAGPVNLLLVILLAYNLAGLTLYLLPQPATAPPVTAARPAADTASSATDDYASIAGWQLFGAPTAAAPAPPPVEAPETRLDLRLAGIVYRQGRPLALIAQGRQPETVHRVGDSLQGARIEQILPDRVLLARSGQLEALSLPRDTDAVSPAAPSRTAATGTVDATPIARRLRRQLDGNPTALQELAYATPYVQDGRFVGLKLRPGRDQRLLGQLGLRTGDVLTAVNGVALTDPAQSLMLLRDMLSRDRVDATILRGGNELSMTFELQ